MAADRTGKDKRAPYGPGLSKPGRGPAVDPSLRRSLPAKPHGVVIACVCYETVTPPAGESETHQRLSRIVPWVASVGLHIGLIGLAFVVTWSVVSLTDDEDPVLVTAEFDALTYDPLSTPEAQDQPVPEPSEAPSIPVEPLEQVLREQLAELDVPAISVDAGVPMLVGAADFAAAPTANAATFVGLTTTNARRIVYVIDASGSMIRSLQIVIRELARSLATLSPRQSFAIIFFQRNQAVSVPPANRLTPATAQARALALNWIDDRVIPAGRSNPLAALERGLSLRPDVLFLLSENITGSGEFEIDQADLLRLLDELNPIDRKTGRRVTLIKCVQFLDPDPLETLRHIARDHGGPDGYRFLSRAELGLQGR